MAVDPKLLSAGIERHRAGDFPRAHAIYLEILAANPAEPMPHNLLGALAIDAGQPLAAVEHLEQALRLDPRFAPALDNLGLVAGSQNRWAEAANYFRRFLALEPNNLATLNKLVDALSRLGSWIEAIDVQRRVVELLPRDMPARFQLASMLTHSGRRVEAIAEFQETLRLRADVPEAWANLAKLYFEEKAFDEAVRSARRAIGLRPDFAEAYHNLGCALAELGQRDEAIKALRTSLRLNPALSEAAYNLGAALVDAGQFEAAIAHYRRMLAERPGEAEALCRLGAIDMTLGEMDRAVEHFDLAIAAQPDHEKSHFLRATALQLAGKLIEGYAEYEWRYHAKDQAPDRWPWPLWQGEPLAGRKLVICCEGGRGDLLQYVRYAPLLKAQGARVIVVYPAAFHPIMARTPGVDDWCASGEEVPEPDYYLPLMSLPHRLRTTLETIPAKIPYVFADPALVAAWRQKLADYRGLKVGIVWQGSPRFAADRWRSISLAHYEPLSRVPGVRLVSLQKGLGEEQLAAFAASWPVLELGPDVDTSAGAFMDTAAVMMNLDLVITSDTAAAHLAGALGIPVWVALQKLPEGRWLLDRQDSPWYPTMRLFRQTTAGDWPGVFEQMARELKRWPTSQGPERT